MSVNDCFYVFYSGDNNEIYFKQDSGSVKSLIRLCQKKKNNNNIAELSFLLSLLKAVRFLCVFVSICVSVCFIF